MKTRYEKIKLKIANAEKELYSLESEKEDAEEELMDYRKRHRSLLYDGLETDDVKKLDKIYAYFDSRYPLTWQGGLRCDSRGMKLCTWLDDDPDYLILHLTSTCENICFSGSTSWRVKAVGLEEKIEVLKQIKKDIKEILDERSHDN